MNKKTIGLGIATLAIGMSLAVPSVDAFFGGNKEGRDGAQRQMTQERLDELRTLFSQNSSVDSFRAAMEQFRVDHKMERETRRADRSAMRDSVSHDVELIENGVIKIITSDDAEMVAKIQERVQGREQKQEGATRIIELLDNGVKITITSDDPEHVERMQDRAENMGKGEKGRGHGMDRGRGFGRNSR